MALYISLHAFNQMLLSYQLENQLVLDTADFIAFLNSRNCYILENTKNTVNTSSPLPIFQAHWGVAYVLFDLYFNRFILLYQLSDSLDSMFNPNYSHDDIRLLLDHSIISANDIDIRLYEQLTPKLGDTSLPDEMPFIPEPPNAILFTPTPLLEEKTETPAPLTTNRGRRVRPEPASKYTSSAEESESPPTRTKKKADIKKRNRESAQRYRDHMHALYDIPYHHIMNNINHYLENKTSAVTLININTLLSIRNKYQELLTRKFTLAVTNHASKVTCENDSHLFNNRLSAKKYREYKRIRHNVIKDLRSEYGNLLDSPPKISEQPKLYQNFIDLEISHLTAANKQIDDLLASNNDDYSHGFFSTSQQGRRKKRKNERENVDPDKTLSP